MSNKLEKEATTYAWKEVRKKAKKNPCGQCEQVDCEGCEHFKSK